MKRIKPTRQNTGFRRFWRAYLGTRRITGKKSWHLSVASIFGPSRVYRWCCFWECWMLWSRDRALCRTCPHNGYENRSRTTKNRCRTWLQISLVGMQEPSRMVPPLYRLWSLGTSGKISCTRRRTACMERENSAWGVFMWIIFQESKSWAISRFLDRPSRSQMIPPLRSVFLW